MWESQFDARQLARGRRARGFARAAGGGARPRRRRDRGGGRGRGVDDRALQLPDRAALLRPPGTVAKRMAADGISACSTSSRNWRVIVEKLGDDVAQAMYGRLPWLEEHGVRLLAGTDAGLPGLGVRRPGGRAGAVRMARVPASPDPGDRDRGQRRRAGAGAVTGRLEAGPRGGRPGRRRRPARVARRAPQPAAGAGPGPRGLGSRSGNAQFGDSVLKQCYCSATPPTKESPMHGPTQLFTVIALVSLPTVMYGGYALMGVLRDRKLTEHQRAMFRAGHAHAGVLLILALVALQILSRTTLSDTDVVDRLLPAAVRDPRPVRRVLPPPDPEPGQARRPRDVRRRGAPGRRHAAHRLRGRLRLSAGR